MIKLFDRIKERTFTIGTGNFALSGVFNGFSSFASVYNNGDKFFYVANDGSNFEIGSGIYLSANNQIQRFPIKSSNNNQKVNFPEGLKEVYVNYPATNCVFNGSGIDVLPTNSGLAFWTSSNSLSSENSFYIDSGNHRLGLNKSNPATAIDVGGSLQYSKIRASGFIVGLSGIYFPSGNNNNSSYIGGQQLVHYEMNQVNSNTGANAVIQLSGSVNQNILLKKQNAGTFFAGPVSGCSPSCDPDYPIFRPITVKDLPELSSTLLALEGIEKTIYHDGRLITSDGVNSSGFSITYSRFTNEAKEQYRLSLFDPNSESWNDYLIPFGGISLDTSELPNPRKNSYQIFDIFAYYDSSNQQIKLSGIPWNEEASVFSSGLLYDFENLFDGYIVDYIVKNDIDPDILNNETPFNYSYFNNDIQNGDIVLVTSQDNEIENGVYIAIDYLLPTSGKLLRAFSDFFPAAGDVVEPGFIFYNRDENELWYVDSEFEVNVGIDPFPLSSFGDLVSNLGGRFLPLYEISKDIYVLSSDYTKRYMGTIFTVNRGLVLDTNTNRHIFNAHNRILKPIKISKNNLSWNYSSNAWRSVPTSYISYGSVVTGLSNFKENFLTLNGVVKFSSDNIQSNSYTIGIGINDNPLPPSLNNIISIIDHISVDSNDNISKTLKTTCSYQPELGFNAFNLIEKGKSGNSVIISLDDNSDSDNHGGLFALWYC